MPLGASALNCSTDPHNEGADSIYVNKDMGVIKEEDKEEASSIETQKGSKERKYQENEDQKGSDEEDEEEGESSYEEEGEDESEED